MCAVVCCGSWENTLFLLTHFESFPNAGDMVNIYCVLGEEVWREVNATCGAASTVDWSTFTISAQVHNI